MITTTGQHSLITDYLNALGVPHTEEYSNMRFSKMPFQTMFGFTKLLQEYGITSEGYRLTDKSEISKIGTPFLADTPRGFVIITDISSNKISYLTYGISETMPLSEFVKAWNGNVVLSFPSSNAEEPDYALHARVEFFMRAKKKVLACVCAIIFIYLFMANGIYYNLSTILVSAIDLCGLYLTYLLVQKSLNIHNPTADKVCRVLQEGGCDSILEMKASKFFGIFGWSEVGFAYFSVSLCALLLLPRLLPWLALCNLCCLPFTCWSIWYQKFRVHKWCTLCVCVQCSLWLLFFCYLFGGWLKMAWPIESAFFILGLTYLAVMLGINAIMPLIENKKNLN